MKKSLPLVALSAGFLGSQLSAATLTVCASGCEYPTIQGAIDHAANNDVIFIQKGHYFETLNTKGKGLTLQGANTRQAIIDGRWRPTIHNSAGTNGGGFSTNFGFRGGGTSVVSGVYVIENTAGDHGGGIFNNGSLSGTGLVVADNQPDNCFQPFSTGCP